jgi:hypothetical protein
MKKSTPDYTQGMLATVQLRKFCLLTRYLNTLRLKYTKYDIASVNACMCNLAPYVKETILTGGVWEQGDENICI